MHPLPLTELVWMLRTPCDGRCEGTNRLAYCVALGCLLSLCCGRALALDPTLDISQYAHTAWKYRDGFAKGVAFELAQTPDGYLWLGTTNGLMRFDGVRNVPWQPPDGTALPDNRVRALLVARDGTLWIGTWAGLASWNGRTLVTHSGLADRVVNALAEDREGTIWVAGVTLPQTAFLCAIRGVKTDCSTEHAAFGRVGSLHEARDGSLWVGAINGLWRQQPGIPKEYSLPEPNTGSLHMFSETAEGVVLVLTRNAILRIVDEQVEPFPIPDLPRDALLSQILVDHDGGIWIGTLDAGLIHLHDGRIDRFRRSDGLSSDRIFDLFEDREGSVWVSTFGGVDRFRLLPVTTYSAAQGLSGSQGVSVLADRDGSVWIDNTEGLYRWHGGRVFAYRPKKQEPPPSQPAIADEIVVPGLAERSVTSLYQDRIGRIWLGSQKGLGFLEKDRFTRISGVPNGYIDSIAEDRDGHLWIAHRDSGLLHVSADLTVQNVPLMADGKTLIPYRLAIDPVRGGLWLGFLSGGVVHFADGRIDASYTSADGLGKGIVNDIRVAADGTVWAATDGGLTRIKGDRFATLNSKNGLPCDAVHSATLDDDGATWVYATCALVRIATSDLDAWGASVDQGKPAPTVPMTVLDDADGVPGFLTPGSTATPHLTKARDGKLWFLSVDGVAVVDPRNLHTNSLAPPVHVEAITADRTPHETSSPVHLPPLVRDLEIDYTALSLVAPERNQFRYQLEGRDRDWHDAGNRRQAFYTDLGPGNYRFRVTASNNSGVWNEAGASLDFSVAPAYWQTNWFRVLCVAVFLAVLWALYQLRARQLARQFNITLETRVSERTRIARELHDTLLQSFHGLLLRFQTAMDLLPNRAAEAKQLLGSAIGQAADAITEGRDAVQGLRASTVEPNALGDAIRVIGKELAVEASGGDVTLNVEVQGAPRNLHPIVRDEVFRIAGEALRNAFRHAQAKQIEVELRYDERSLRLRVRDDGKGIAADVLSRGGREGHFGLRGMRERAKGIGGELTVWSRPEAGTEVELILPGARAYAPSSSKWRSLLARRRQRPHTIADS